MENIKAYSLLGAPANAVPVIHRDPEFLSALFSSMNPRLMGYLAGHRIFGGEAEELIHESWGTFFENAAAFRGEAKIDTFIFGILINKVREHRRRVGRTDYVEDSEKVYGQAFTVGGWWAQTPESPERLLSVKGLGQLIGECLEGLSTQQRDAFLLIEADGISSDQVCHVLGVNVSHLRVLIYRAKNKLRLCLQSAGEEPS